ncbi:MAG: tellurite resistance TerB family protein [Parvularculaceae bacterium]
MDTPKLENPKKLLDQLFGNAKTSFDELREKHPDLAEYTTGKKGMATAAGVGALAALILGGGKPGKAVSRTVKLGGMALVGGLAWQAYQNWQDGKDADASGDIDLGKIAPPKDEDFVPDSEVGQADLANTLILAMLTAAKADGRVGDDERQRIKDGLNELGVVVPDQQELDALLASPLDINAIVEGVNNDKQAAEVYLASLLAIDPNKPVEKGYLAMLAARLGLEDKLVAHLHQSAGAVG